eukprot:scaffold1766_cov401-Prasinococcus_capsulatus_cf.AAC.27
MHAGQAGVSSGAAAACRGRTLLNHGRSGKLGTSRQACTCSGACLRTRRGSQSSPDRRGCSTRNGFGVCCNSGLTETELTPPWKNLSCTVYSFATLGDTASMNITTYTTPVSISPDKRYMVALFKNTMSHENFIQGSGHGVLQILTKEHQDLVALLGKQSGYDVDKLKEIEASGHSLTRVREGGAIPVLQGCVGYISLRMENFYSAGDHDVAICVVDGYSYGTGSACIVVALTFGYWHSARRMHRPTCGSCLNALRRLLSLSRGQQTMPNEQVGCSGVALMSASRN